MSEWETELPAIARRWFYDGYPADATAAAQLLVYVELENDLTAIYAVLLEQKARLYDEWLAVALRLLECYANGEATP